MPDTRPNLLLLIPDQHRWDFGPWNPQSPLRLPNLAGLAARGVQFDQAIVNSPLCAPMRASLASGRSYGSCGVIDNGNDYPLDLPTFYQQLRGAGYQVCGTGKFDLHKVSGGWGLDGQNGLDDWGFTRGIDNEGKWDGYRNFRDTGQAQGPYYKFLVENDLAEAHCQDFERRGRDYSDGKDYGSTFPTTLPDFAYGDNWIGRNTIDILRELPEGQPWFMQVNFTGPHEPQDITASMWQSCQGVEHPGPLASSQHDAEFHNRARQNYGAMLENIDARIGEIIAAIERRGELENTVIVYTSDHGEMLGDHDEWQKSRPWQSALAVPLIAAGPGVARGQTSRPLSRCSIWPPRSSTTPAPTRSPTWTRSPSARRWKTRPRDIAKSSSRDFATTADTPACRPNTRPIVTSGTRPLTGVTSWFTSTDTAWGRSFSIWNRTRPRPTTWPPANPTGPDPCSS